MLKFLVNFADLDSENRTWYTFGTLCVVTKVFSEIWKTNIKRALAFFEMFGLFLLLEIWVSNIGLFSKQTFWKKQNSDI